MDADALAMKLADAVSSRESTPSDEDLLENYKLLAYRCHDMLVEMGGRPTRKVLEKPGGKAIYEKDQIRILDDHGELQVTLSPNANLVVHHWKTECTLFEDELDRWKDFRKLQEHVPLLNLTFDPQNTDQRLTNVLVKLNDWREFQYYQQRVKIGRALMSMWYHIRMMKNILGEEPTSKKLLSSPDMQRKLARYFRDEQVFSRQMSLETSQSQLAWINGQILEILAEACTSLEACLSLQQQLEMKLQQQARAFDQELKNLKARPVRTVQSPHQSADFAQRISHWGSEITRLMHEHEEWKIFLRWRKSPTSTEEGEQASSEPSSDIEIWKSYVAYRRHQLKRARNLVAGWRLLLTFRENEISTCDRDCLFMLEDTISELRADVEKFQQDVQIAECRVRSAEQQLTQLSSQHFSPTIIQMTQRSIRHSQLPLSHLESESTKSIPERARSSSSPPKVRRARTSTTSPISEIPGLDQLSNFANKEREIRAEDLDTDIKQLFVVPNHVIADDDIQMITGSDCSPTAKAIRDSEGAEVINTPQSDAKDTLTMDDEDPINPHVDIVSGIHSRRPGIQISRDSCLLPHAMPISTTTRSAKKLDQTLSGRVVKTASKMPGQKHKALSR